MALLVILLLLSLTRSINLSLHQSFEIPLPILDSLSLPPHAPRLFLALLLLVLRPAAVSRRLTGPLLRPESL